VDAPLVFAGYGITAPESSYDDYQGLDAKGKIVLALRGEPGSLSQSPRRRPLAARVGHFQSDKRQESRRAAIIVVNGKLPNGEEDVLPRFGEVEGPKTRESSACK